MTATVFIILLVCLLAMRFFFTCLIVLLIGVFILSDQPAARAAPAAQCDPVFVRMNAELIHATVACNKNYMDTALGVEIGELSSICYATIGETKSTTIARAAMLKWENFAKDNGKKQACAETSNMFNAIKAAIDSIKN